MEEKVKKINKQLNCVKIVPGKAGMRELWGFEGDLLKPSVLFMYNRVMKKALSSGGGILYYPNTLTPGLIHMPPWMLPAAE